MVRYYATVRQTDKDEPLLIAKKEIERFADGWRNRFGNETTKLIIQKVTWVDNVKTIEETDVTEANE